MARKGYGSVTIHESTDKLVTALAKKYQRSKSWIIEEAVKYYVEHHEGGNITVQESPQQSP